MQLYNALYSSCVTAVSLWFILHAISFTWKFELTLFSPDNGKRNRSKPTTKSLLNYEWWKKPLHHQVPFALSHHSPKVLTFHSGCQLWKLTEALHLPSRWALLARYAADAWIHNSRQSVDSRHFETLWNVSFPLIWVVCCIFLASDVIWTKDVMWRRAWRLVRVFSNTRRHDALRRCCLKFNLSAGMCEWFLPWCCDGLATGPGPVISSIS